MADEPLPPSPGQTVGPFFHFGLDYPGANHLVDPGHPDAIRLYGRVVDGAGEPVPDALIELWQAGPDGAPVQSPGHIARDGSFTGFGRAATDTDGTYEFVTLEPGPTGLGEVPFFAITVFARGLLDRLQTRAYLPDKDDARSAFLDGLTESERASVSAHRDNEGNLEFTIVLQGEGETVFLTHDPREGDHA